MHVSHNVMPSLLFFFYCNLEVNVSEVTLHFMDLVISDWESQFLNIKQISFTQ